MFNYNKMSEMLKERWLDEQARTWGYQPFKLNEVRIEKKDDFFIGIGKMVGTQPIVDDIFMQRYFLYIYSIGQLQVIYTDSNVVAASAEFTATDVINKAMRMLNHELTKLGNI